MGLTSDDISRLYARHAEELLGYFARRTMQAEVAVDLVVETFAQAFVHREEFRGNQDGEAIAWVYGIPRGQLGSYFHLGWAIADRAPRARIVLSPGGGAVACTSPLACQAIPVHRGSR